VVPRDEEGRLIDLRDHPRDIIGPAMSQARQVSHKQDSVIVGSIEVGDVALIKRTMDITNNSELKAHFSQG
jgi:hypothetical protein